MQETVCQEGTTCSAVASATSDVRQVTRHLKERLLMSHGGWIYKLSLPLCFEEGGFDGRESDIVCSSTASELPVASVIIGACTEGHLLCYTYRGVMDESTPRANKDRGCELLVATREVNTVKILSVYWNSSGAATPSSSKNAAPPPSPWDR